MPCRTVRFTRSMKAVFSRPEKPKCCKASLRASSVPRRITCVTCTSLRQRSAFLHLAVDQAWRHLPSAPVASSTTRGKPLAKVGGESIKVAIEPATGKQWDATRRQPLLESMDEPMGHGLGARAQFKRRKKLGEGIDRRPEKDESDWRCGAWCAVHPIAGAGGGDGRRSARVSSQHACLHG
jgi:hypothetical protein